MICSTNIIRGGVSNSSTVSCINVLKTGVHITADHCHSILSLLIVDKIQRDVLIS
jgi:hypothetical protein